MKKEIQLSKKRFIKLILIILIILFFGTSGYIIIEDFSFLEAFYMTVITITTVGFQEVKPLDDSGRIFTLILIFSSFGYFAYSISVITSLFIDGKLAIFYKDIKLRKEIKKMKKHTIVVGYGRNGKQAIHELSLHHEPVVVIDSNVNIQEQNSILKKWVIGDATTDEVLMEAGIQEAKAIIIALPDDADNLYISISAKSINPKIMIISRASSESAERKLKAIGVTHVIMPEKVGGIYMAGYVAQSDLTEFMDHLRVDHSNPGILAEIDCRLINERNQDSSVEALLSEKHQINVLGVKKNNKEFVIAPIRALAIRDIEKIFIMGTKDHIDELKTWLHA